MTSEILPIELTDQEIQELEAKAIDLCKKYQTPKVHVYVGLVPETNERVIGFLREPSYVQKLYAMDKISTAGIFIAGDELRNIIMLKEESDPRTYDDVYGSDEFKLGVVSKCIEMINLIRDAFKKK